MSRLLFNIARVAFVLCLPVLLISASIAVAVNSPWLYRMGFQKYNISRVTGIAPAELNKAARGLITYFNSTDSAGINVTVVKDGKLFPLFNDREIKHLRDVKDLFWLDYRVLFLALTYAVAYAIMAVLKRKYRSLAYLILGSAALTLAIILGLGIASLADFDQLFVQFHLLSFANDFWQLDPARDYLVMLFPEGFWYDTAMICLGMAASDAIIMGGVAFVYLRRSRPQNTEPCEEPAKH